MGRLFRVTNGSVSVFVDPSIASIVGRLWITVRIMAISANFFRWVSRTTTAHIALFAARDRQREDKQGKDYFFHDVVFW
jgi:hypothetical protein